MRRSSRAVELDDIISSQIIGNDRDIIAIVMKAHLALEALMQKMIRSFRTDAKIYKLSSQKRLNFYKIRGPLTRTTSKPSINSMTSGMTLRISLGMRLL